MSIWISKPAALGLALLGLCACEGINLVGPSRAVLVQGGAFSVAPPAGYCAGGQAQTDASGSAVVLMGRCSAASAAQPALITASIGADGTGSALDAGPVALTNFFTSQAGRAMLASSGKADDAAVLGSELQEDAVLLRVNDAALGEYWRAILALKGRLVMLSATGAGDVDLPPAQGRALLSQSITALRRANSDPSAPSPAAAPFGGLFATPKAAAPTAASAVSVAAPPVGSVRPRPRAPISG